MFLSRLILLSSLATIALSASWIVPGAVWTDTKGNRIDAHGGGIVKHGSLFYWVGWSAANTETPFMYSSPDLLNWTPLGAQASITGMWRPKIAKPNGSYWIYGQTNRLVQALESSTMVGGYKTHGAAVSLPPNAYTYSDTGMFEDSDGTWYILTSADHNVVQINKINSDGSVGARVNRLAVGAYEAPGILLSGGIYYLIVSGKTGWRYNPNKMFYATSITGAWTGPFDIAPESTNTYGSQNTFELTVGGSKATTYVYMGDAWDKSGGTGSNYVWLPVAVDKSKKTFTLQDHAMWKVDPTTGVVSVPVAKKRYEAEHATLSGRARIRDCEHCLSKRAVHGGAWNSELIFRNITGTGKKEWLSIHYTVNNPEAGSAHISLNGHPLPTNISDYNSRAGFYTKVPIELKLEMGDENWLTIGAVGKDDFEMVVDGIELYEEEL